MEINKELKDLGIKIPKSNAFATPNNYFEGVEEDIEMAIFLDTLPKTNVYEVSKNYFENFTYKKAPTKIVSFTAIKWVVAASVFGLIILGTIFKTKNNESLALTTINSNTAYDYLNNNLEDIQEEDLLPLVENKISGNELLDLDNIDNKELEKYLNNTNDI